MNFIFSELCKLSREITYWAAIALISVVSGVPRRGRPITDNWSAQNKLCQLIIERLLPQELFKQR